MNHQDRISILLTFACGFFVGGYLYVIGFAPTYHLPEAVTQEAYDGLVVVADTYGGCRDEGNCLSFQLLSDRNYRAVLGTDTEGVTFDGTISRKAMNSLLESVVESELVANARTRTLSQCLYTDEGASNFRFLVTYQGKNYTLDTCNSMIDYNAALWQSLRLVYREVAESAGS